MKYSNSIKALVITGALIFPANASAQSSLNIGPPPQPCTPGFPCGIAPPPPPPTIGVVPPCFPPNRLVQIRDNFGTRFICQTVQVQPVFPVQPIQPVQPVQPVQPAPGQYSQAHYEYCFARFKSYRQATNTYTSFSGKTRFCNSPFN